MLHSLILSNFVLVEHAEIQFGPAFNGITGETGAGKTAILEAIALTLGNRADTALIRSGAESAMVEATFDIATLPLLHALLEEGAIPFEPNDPLIIRREISREGKNRTTLNCRPVPLPFLQKVGRFLIDLVDQSAHHILRSSEEQLSLLDLFGKHSQALSAYQSAYAHERSLQRALSGLEEKDRLRAREEDTFRYQLQEIETLALKEGEEDHLFEKYQRIANTQQILEKLSPAVEQLTELLSELPRLYKTTDSLAKFDPAFKEPLQYFDQARLSLQEASHLLETYHETLDRDPKAFEFLEERLSAIQKLKRKYGSTFAEIQAFKEKLQAALQQYETLSDDMEKLRQEIAIARAQTQNLALKLTALRQRNAAKLEKLLTNALQELNMPQAKLKIQIQAGTRTLSGDDAILFWLAANPGESPGLVSEHSSGGELSRLLFAIKVALADQNATPTLIFDEIDANVGGTTATLIGEKLAELGSSRQVICITHFPQVASKAQTHFSVQKAQYQGRTTTQIKLLSSQEREQELLRMLGGQTTLSLFSK